MSKNADKFVPRLTGGTPVVPAELRNDAGIVGAAIVAVEGFADAPSTCDDLPTGSRTTSSYRVARRPGVSSRPTPAHPAPEHVRSIA